MRRKFKLMIDLFMNKFFEKDSIARLTSGISIFSLLITTLVALVAFLTTFFLTPVTIFFAKKTGLVDDPKKHKHPALLHTKPIPRGGSIPLFIGIALSSLLFLPLTKITLVLFCAAFIALLIGIIDDKYDISPNFRFFMNIIS